MPDDQKPNDKASGLLVVAGEPSGDHHLSKVVADLKKQKPDLEIWGIGGDHLKNLGVEILFHNSELSVVGIKEVISQFPEIRKAFYGVLTEAKKRKPKAALLVDYPDFNLRLAKKLKAQGIPVFYYIAPQAWAWRSGRAFKMAKIIDKLFAILPFEKEFFEKAGVNVEFVGHPILDESWVNTEPSRQELLKIVLPEFSGPDETRFISLLPGSRKSEIRHHIELMLECAAIVLNQHKKIHFLLPVAHGMDKDYINRKIEEAHLLDSISVIEGNNAVSCLQLSHSALVASGTATLEAGVAGVPSVVTYRISGMSAMIFKMLSSYEGYIALLNLVAGKMIFPEFIQDKSKPILIAAELIKLLDDQSYWKEKKEQLKSVKGRLGNPGGSGKVSKGVLECLSV